MTRTKWFFLKRNADAYAAQLRSQGHADAWVDPAKTWGPMGCRHLPFSGWKVIWFQEQ